MSGYCAGCDPILAARRFTCLGCGGKAYVTDAEWIGGLILATYEQDHTRECRRGGGFPDTWTILSDLSSDDTFIRAPEDNADKAANHYHIQETGYPIGTRFCPVCKVPLPAAADSWICDKHRCTAATTSGLRCSNSAKVDGLCRVHLAQRERRATREGRA